MSKRVYGLAHELFFYRLIGCWCWSLLGLIHVLFVLKSVLFPAYYPSSLSRGGDGSQQSDGGSQLRPQVTRFSVLILRPQAMTSSHKFLTAPPLPLVLSPHLPPAVPPSLPPSLPP